MEDIIVSNKDRLYTVKQGDKSAIDLSYDEMLAVFVSLSLPEKRAGLQWMETDEQRKENYQNIPTYTNEETGEIGKMIRPKTL